MPTHNNGRAWPARAKSAIARVASQAPIPTCWGRGGGARILRLIHLKVFPPLSARASHGGAAVQGRRWRPAQTLLSLLRKGLPTPHNSKTLTSRMTTARKERSALKRTYESLKEHLNVHLQGEIEYMLVFLLANHLPCGATSSRSLKLSEMEVEAPVALIYAPSATNNF